MAIEDQLVARSHGNTVQAYRRIDTGVNPPQLVGYRVVVPAGHVIYGNAGAAPFSFDHTQATAIGGIIPLEEAIDGVWEPPVDEVPGRWAWPPVTWSSGAE